MNLTPRPPAETHDSLRLAASRQDGPEPSQPAGLPFPTRRDLLRAGALAAAGTLAAPSRATAQTQPRAVPRNRTLVVVWGGREGRWVDHELWNPYAIGANHQNGVGLLYEPLAYYNLISVYDKCKMFEQAEQARQRLKERFAKRSKTSAS